MWLLPAFGAAAAETPKDVLAEFRDPPREFSLMPFWFWNDELKEEELLRQMDDFEAHGVYGFVIHPRIGLPRDTGWMSPKLLRFMKLAVEKRASGKCTSSCMTRACTVRLGVGAGRAHNPAHANARGRRSI